MTEYAKWIVEAKFADMNGGNKTPSFTMEAYNGGPLPVDGFPLPVVVDLATAKFRYPDQTPILYVHDDSKNLGHTTQQEISPTDILMAGLISNDNEYTRDVIHAAKAGKKWKASIGANFPKPELIKAGKSITVNGRVQTGPFLLARQAEIFETSILPNGADVTSKVQIAATLKKGKKVSETTLPDVDIDKIVNEKLEAALGGFNEKISESINKTIGEATTKITEGALGEIQRANEVRTLCASFGNPTIEIGEGDKKEKVSLEAHALKTKMPIREVQLEAELFKVQAAGTPAAPMMVRGSLNYGEKEIGECLKASLAVNHFGISPDDLKEEYSDKALQAAHSKELRGFGIKDLFMRVIQAAGKGYHGSMNSDDFIKAAFEASNELKASGTSTLVLDNIFEDVTSKSLLNSFMLAATTWRKFTGVTSSSDFKPVKMYRLTEDGGFQELGKDGELKHIGVTDTKRTVEIDSKGAIITLTYQMIKNDDLGALKNITQRIGRMASVRIEEDAYKLLLSLIGSFFTAGNGNYISGADTVLGPDSLATAVQKFRDRVDANNNPVLASPSNLIAGTALESIANSLYKDQQFRVGTSAKRVETVFNQHVGQFAPCISPYMNNTAIKDSKGKAINNQSATQWLLTADPNEYPTLQAAFLNGNETPIVETSEMSFEKLGVQMRGHMHFGFGEAESLGAVYSKGAA